MSLIVMEHVLYGGVLAINDYILNYVLNICQFHKHCPYTSVHNCFAKDMTIHHLFRWKEKGKSVLDREHKTSFLWFWLCVHGSVSKQVMVG